jgi:hypothetical protein
MAILTMRMIYGTVEVHLDFKDSLVSAERLLKPPFLSIHTNETIRESLNKFSWHFMLDSFTEIWQHNPILFKLDRNEWHSSWWLTYISAHISSITRYIFIAAKNSTLQRKITHISSNNSFSISIMAFEIVKQKWFNTLELLGYVYIL